MSASLVGSEMCIRDRPERQAHAKWFAAPRSGGPSGFWLSCSKWPGMFRISNPPGSPQAHK
eukprot:4597041-Alexandrium_andersonii.AAC.1